MLVRLFCAVAFLIGLCPFCVFGQATKPHYEWSAVNSAGKRFNEREFPEPKRAPWLRDVIKDVKPRYPYEERGKRHMGRGLFRMAIDLKTGSVRKVTIVRSTGYKLLDQATREAL